MKRGIIFYLCSNSLKLVLMNKFLFLIVALFVFHNLLSQKYHALENYQEFEKNYKEKSATITSIKSQFIQEKSISFLENKLIVEGIFYYKAPSKVRMEYQKPFNYLFILNNDKILLKSKDNTTTIPTSTNRIFRIISRITVDCVNGNIFKNKDFRSEIQENDSFYKVIMIPKDDELSDFFSDIVVYVSKEDLMVEKLEMNEQSGDATEIRFLGKEINKPVNDALFNIQ